MDRKRRPKKLEETYDEKNIDPIVRAGSTDLEREKERPLPPVQPQIQPARKRVRFSRRSCFFHDVRMYARCDRLERVRATMKKQRYACERGAILDPLYGRRRRCARISITSSRTKHARWRCTSGLKPEKLCDPARKAER